MMSEITPLASLLAAQSVMTAEDAQRLLNLGGRLWFDDIKEMSLSGLTPDQIEECIQAGIPAYVVTSIINRYRVEPLMIDNIKQDTLAYHMHKLKLRFQDVVIIPILDGLTASLNWLIDRLREYQKRKNN